MKVSKFRKQIFLFSFEPKSERNYFLISALASKYRSNQKNEGTLSYQLWSLFFDLTYFRSLGQKSKIDFVRFLVQMRTRKFAFEIQSSCFLRMTKSSPPIWHLLHNVKSMVKISSIFPAFLENMYFNIYKYWSYNRNIRVANLCCTYGLER